MKSGDSFTDNHGTQWTIEGKLGRGTWGESWGVRNEERAAVLKLPLLASAFPDAEDAGTLAAACAATATATRDLLGEANAPFLPSLLGTATMSDGRQGLLLPELGASLEARLAAGVPLTDVLDIVVQTLHRLATAGQTAVIHGNLRPSNIFLDEQGKVVLTDSLVDVVRSHRATLEAHCPGRPSYLPPEAGFHPNGGWDCWSCCCVLFRACSAPSSSDDPRRGSVVRLPEHGLDRVALASVRDAAASRLRSENANPRFAGRATEKLGAVLNRGLSAEAEPSPPYRFDRVADLRARLVEVDELVHPAVETVSKVLLGPEATDGVFEGGDEVSFSVNVGSTRGVVGHEDIAVGVNLRDLDAPGDGRVRLADSRFHVDRYPSGRWRFSFVIPDITPGRYQLRVAFAVKGSDGAPSVAEGEFEVRPRPGYVPPPAEESPPPPITFPGTPGRSDPEASNAPPADDAPPPPSFSPATAEPETVVSEPVLEEPTVSPRPAPPRPSRSAEPVRPQPRPASPEPAPGPETTTWSKPSAKPPVAPPPAPPQSESPPEALPEVPPPPVPELPDPALQDYPFPTSAGSDLPGYDANRSGSGGPLGALGERASELFRGDPVTVIMGSVALGFILLVLVLALARSC